MRILELTSAQHATAEERQDSVLEAIAELEQQHRDGLVDTSAYAAKKRFLVRLL